MVGTGIFWAGGQRSGKESADNLIDPAGNPGNDLYIHGCQQIFHAVADPAADQDPGLMPIQELRDIAVADDAFLLVIFPEQDKSRGTAQGGGHTVA